MVQHMQARPGRSQSRGAEKCSERSTRCFVPLFGADSHTCTEMQKCRNAEMQMCASSTQHAKDGLGDTIRCGAEGGGSGCCSSWPAGCSSTRSAATAAVEDELTGLPKFGYRCLIGV
ncbi:hypothetical protein HBI56_179180 [Parastagonospora nodorum]|uniref:Uncharacterized protein n=1 Tax=Phaeosphaeria nodorum (strain SN15 / ATCC MYA-4574 / FGSC 10173) TaxID=321614 RepID=A0A7U2ET61_PHANO|nr:hypothetical protein HBH56_046090 [Parastagonospora nodorum]QRC92635.1 hypothetical protein JI435_402770 [Parastagonospora nodorum SN15]KAH3933292.1 hypothetical protein HBH54_073840 [Parastagonospora nodorum]KAH3946299.1 hypothetical protein HBH53_132990 [Parastagonospora nodorum]KAH3973210.1 hypothetical protein HBH52_145890 [Parastagonospora nodorum]